MTPDQAATLALEVLGDGWERGTPVVSGVLEDDDRFVVSVGCDEYVTGNDPRFLLVDVPLVVVDKVTEAVTFVPYVGNESWLTAMTDARR